MSCVNRRFANSNGPASGSLKSDGDLELNVVKLFLNYFLILSQIQIYKSCAPTHRHLGQHLHNELRHQAKRRTAPVKQSWKTKEQSPEFLPSWTPAAKAGGPDAEILLNSLGRKVNCKPVVSWRSWGTAGYPKWSSHCGERCEEAAEWAVARAHTMHTQCYLNFESGEPGLWGMFQLENFKLASGAFCTERLNERWPRRCTWAVRKCDSAWIEVFFQCKAGPQMQI